MKLLKSAFVQSLKSSPFVFKNISLYFAGYFFLFSTLFYILLYNSAFKETLESVPRAQYYVQFVLLILAHIFIIFMIPFYTYRYNTGSSPNFWTFIADKVWLLVLNQIKAFFVILFFLILFILPGIYKVIRLYFLTESVFFEKEPSFLKKSAQCSKGRFWTLVLFIVFIMISKSLSGLLAQSLTASSSFIPSVFSLCLSFYISSFLILLKTQFYFQLKKEKGQEVSL